MGKITKEQIAEWKTLHKELIQLETENAHMAILRDPFYDLNVLKLSVTALRESDYDFVSCILANCWLAGDEEIRKNESYQNFLADNLKELFEMPEYKIDPLPGEMYQISSLGETISVRMATRADIVKAEKMNHANQPFATAEYILQNIADKEQVLAIKTKNVKAFVGILRGVEEVKDKKTVLIKKL